MQILSRFSKIEHPTHHIVQSDLTGALYTVSSLYLALANMEIKLAKGFPIVGGIVEEPIENLVIDEKTETLIGVDDIAVTISSIEVTTKNDVITVKGNVITTGKQREKLDTQRLLAFGLRARTNEIKLSDHVTRSLDGSIQSVKEVVELIGWDVILPVNPLSGSDNKPITPVGLPFKGLLVKAVVKWNPDNKLTHSLFDEVGLTPAQLAVRPTTYMEVHQLIGTSGCSPTPEMWDWSVMGVMTTTRGKILVCPGDYLITLYDDSHLVLSQKEMNHHIEAAHFGVDFNTY